MIKCKFKVRKHWHLEIKFTLLKWDLHSTLHHDVACGCLSCWQCCWCWMYLAHNNYDDCVGKTLVWGGVANIDNSAHAAFALFWWNLLGLICQSEIILQFGVAFFLTF